jgi:hypothetical protein
MSAVLRVPGVMTNSLLIVIGASGGNVALGFLNLLPPTRTLNIPAYAKSCSGQATYRHIAY